MPGADLTADQYRQATELFLRVCDLEGSQRGSVLDEACRDQPELRAAVEAMLVQDETDSDDLLVRPALMPLQHERDVVPAVPGYRLLDKLGEGGMGVVWRAVQESAQREVAIKWINSASLASERGRARFEREVELAARLEHPGIVRVYDSGESEGVPFYAMELVDGLHLDEYVAAKDLDRREILELLLQVCEAVQHAHGRGMIHRDLKPSNILVSADGRVHVLDFGLVMTVLEDESSGRKVSQTGQLLGTPAFMSPEQAGGGPDDLDSRSDVYSLGVMLYGLLTGMPHHDLEGSPLQVLQRIATQEVTRPRVVDRSLHPELDTLLTKALALDREQRYGTAGELGEDIRNYLQGDPLRARPPTLSYVVWTRVRKHRLAAVAVVAVLCTVVTGVVGYILSINAERTRTREAQARVIEEREHAQRWASVLQTRLADELLHAPDVGSQPEEARRLLDLCPPRFRGWTWRRLRRQCEPHRKFLGPFDQDVRQMILTPDGRELALVLGTYATLLDARVVVVDAATGRERLTIRGHPGLLRAAVSPDGAELYTSGVDAILRRWSLKSGDLLDTIELDVSTPISDLAFAANGRQLVWADARRGLVVLDRDSGARRLLPLHVPAERWTQDYRLAVSPDGRHTAWLTRTWGGDEVGHLKMIDLETGTEMWSVDRRDRTITFMPDSRSLLVGRDGKIVQLETLAGGSISTWGGGHAGHVGDMTLARDGRQLVSVGYHDRRIQLWDVERRSSAGTFLGHAGEIYSVAVSQDGQRVFSGGSVIQCPDILAWSVADIESSRLLTRHREHAAVGVSADGGHVVSVGSDDVRSTSLVSGDEAWRVPAPVRGEQVGPAHLAVGHTPGGAGRVAIAWPSADGASFRLSLLELSTGEIERETSLMGIPQAVCLTSDGTGLAVIAGADDGARVDMILASDLAVTRSLPVSLEVPGAMWHVAFSPDGTTLVAGSEGYLAMWQTETGAALAVGGHVGGVTDLSFLTDGRLLVAKLDRVELRDPVTLEVLATYHSPNRVITGAAMSHAARSLLIWKDPIVEVFDLELDVRLTTLVLPGGEKCDFADATPDGRTIVTGSSGAVRVWHDDPLER